MGKNIDEVIVGCGASALTHLYYAIKSSFTKDPRTCVVIGRDDLWKKIASVDPGHKFGQPAQIVNVRGNQPTLNAPSFQNAGNIDGQLDDMRNFLKECGVSFVEDTVTKIDRSGGDISVKTEGNREYDAKRVIVATGFGRSAPPRTAMPAEVEKALREAGQYGLNSAGGMFQNRIMGGTEYLYDKDIKAPAAGFFRVAVQGASATSSWAVQRAMSLARDGQHVEIAWITRSDYREANPAGRNSDVLDIASKNGWLVKAEVKAMGVPESAFGRVALVLGPVTSAREPTLDISDLGKAYKKFYSNNTGARRNERSNLIIDEIKYETTIYVDHFIYALGADPSLPGGAGHIISETIKKDLKPVFDAAGRFDDDPNATCLGFKTNDDKVWLVGAAVFRGGGIKELGADGRKFANIAAMMCEAGSPPEGIAAIIAGAKALTRWDENNSVRRISLQTADFMEIQNWFAEFYALKTRRRPSEAVKRAMADQIVGMRKHTEFGLSEIEINNLANPDNDFWTELFALREGRRLIDQLALFAA